MEDEIDDGSPMGGAASAAGYLAVVLVVFQLPASYLGIAHMPGCVAVVIGGLAVLIGGLALVTEASPRGRRAAKRGLVLGAMALLAGRRPITRAAEKTSGSGWCGKGTSSRSRLPPAPPMAP